MNAAPVFRFDAPNHLYYAGDRQRPHITGMLERCGLVDQRWYTEEGRQRGTAVHRLCAEYDLGALTDVVGCRSGYKGYLQGYMKARGILRPELLEVEVPRLHPVHLYGGRPDRDVRYLGRVGVLEIKSGAEERAHGVQTALQAILVAPVYHLPPEALVRLCVYLKPAGGFKAIEHVAASDFVEARKIIRECCG